jgi:two-component system response regulator DegU
MKILIVENNPLMRKEIADLLKKEGDEIYQCDDGIYVEEIYENHKPDIIFMDIRMKHMNGLEATKNLTGKYPEARVIIVTNMPDRKLKETAFKNGAKGYFLKDNLADIKEIINKN